MIFVDADKIFLCVSPKFAGVYVDVFILESLMRYLKKGGSPFHPEKLNLKIHITEFGRYVCCSLNQNIGHVAHLKWTLCPWEHPREESSHLLEQM